ncbi:MAG: hypothetical protein M2R45_01147 [Verrucomicrobia subdivision 3 bacterium]|nr:hypothetical protein [Limisphaerales bacterium]MCS1415299.1 hypothetical protein [Limisphaerales bacterium]
MARSGPRAFAANTLKQTVVIDLIDASFFKAPEQFQVALNNPKKATIKDGVVTMRDCEDDSTVVELGGLAVEQDGSGDVLLKWETHSEFDTAGIELRRASMGYSESVELEKVIPKMIVSRGNKRRWRWLQFGDRPGFGCFFYQLEEIELDGHRESVATVLIGVGSMIDELRPMESRMVITRPVLEGWDYTVEYRNQLAGDVAWTPITGAPHNEGEILDRGISGGACGYGGRRLTETRPTIRRRVHRVEAYRKYFAAIPSSESFWRCGFLPHR